MKKVSYLLNIFLIFTIILISCPIITSWDKSIILYVQKIFDNFPIAIALLPDCKLYILMITLPLIIGSIFFIKNKLYKDLLFLLSTPLITFLLNCIIKPLIHRQRPPFEIQNVIHPDSFSYVSSHSLVTICLYGMIIYFLNKYCKNKVIKYFLITLSIFWIFFVGFSRVWLGVHYPTDVIGAYLLGITLIFLYVHLLNRGL